MDKQQLYELVDKFLAGKANMEEKDLLSRYYNSFQQTRTWDPELGDPAETEASIFARIEEKLAAIAPEKTREPLAPVPGKVWAEAVNFRKYVIRSVHIIAAACIFGALVLGTLFWLRNQRRKEVAETKSMLQENRKGAGLRPGRTTLTLANGSQLFLDGLADGNIAIQGSSRISKRGNRLVYSGTAAKAREMYNTISTSEGATFQLELADGSSIWLNAASTIRFPVVFTDLRRTVDMTGEAYFEVAKKKAAPFVVGVDGAQVQVLGTHFNVMAYSDETAMKTTLLEGAVRFVKGVHTSTLSPGQQSRLLKSGKLIVINRVDLEKEIAWKNNLFDFQGDEIKTVTRQLARWYAVEFVFQDSIDDHFIAKLPRSTTLQKMLQLLQLTGKVQFEINGNKVIVKRQK